MEERKAACRGIFDTFGEEENTLKLLYEPLHGEFAEAEGALSKLKFSVTRRVDLKSWMKIGELLFDLRKDPFRDQGGLLQEATAKLLPVWRSAPDAIASSIRERDIRRANLRRFPYHFCSAALATKSEFSSSAITIDFHLLDPDVDRSMAEYAGCRLEWTF